MYQCIRHVISNVSCDDDNVTSLSSLSLAPTRLEVVCELYLVIVLCVVGLLGNILAIVVMRHDTLRREALLLLQILAVIDALYLLTALCRHPLKHLLPATGMYTYLQMFIFPLMKSCQTAAIWLMVLVTVDRYMFVCWPLTAQQWFTGRNRRLLATFTCVLALVYNVPRFFDSCVAEYHDPCSNTTSYHSVYRPKFKNRVYFDVYQYGLYVTLLYALPLAILSFVNFRLVQAIRHSRKFLPRGYTSEREYSDSNATLVLIIIVCVFLVCESPELILKLVVILYRYRSSATFDGLMLLTFNTLSEVLMVVNSSINFFVYVAFGKRFRYIMKETFRYFANSNSSIATHETAPLNLLQRQRHTFVHHKKAVIVV